MPQTYNAVEEEDKLIKLRDEVQYLEEELTKERDENRDLQADIVSRRKRSDELVAMMTLLRSETEAILQRHNILLDSEIAKEAAQKLHEEHVRNRGNNTVSSNADVVPPDDVADETAEVLANKKPVGDKDDDENDGDDEGDNDDDDEDGEIVESGKRGLDDSGESSSPRRKKSRV